MERAITAADANRDFSKMMRAVEKGDTFVVTSHGRRIARIIPIDENLEAAERAKESLLDRLRSQPVIDIGPWTRDELHED